MSRSIKLVLYIVCVVGVIVLGSLTVRSYRQATKTSASRAAKLARAASTESTNGAEATNAAITTNAPEATNLVAAAEAATNTVATNPATARKSAPDDSAEVAGASTRGFSSMVTYGLGLLLFAIGLAVLLAYDISHLFAAKAEQALFADDGAPADPEYEQAEELWKDGKYLEALNAMRDYLKKNPREQYVALRIAEIYEGNLSNPLAAALEYEEVLKKKLPAERWGWAAIHLANIYSGKLSQPEKAIELLRRIDSEYGTTTAAKKARERLMQIDPNFVPAAVAAATASSRETGEGPSNLPPGFRPKT
jgi:TolA-binding protein